MVHLPDESVEILIPQMVRSEQITISYLYQPPLTFDQVNTYAKSDEGFAKITPMVVVAPQSRLWKTVSRVLMLTGVVAITYALFKLVGVQQ